MEAMRELKSAALGAVAAVLPAHSPARFLEFVRERKLEPTAHDALWRTVMLRSKECRKLLASSKMDDYCFCDCCVPLDEEPQGPTTALAKLFVYPSYAYCASAETTDEAVERVVHQYLVRTGKIPKPFEAPIFADHSKIMGFDDPATLITTHVCLNDDVIASIQRVSKTARNVLIVMCGHGASGQPPNLLLSNGRPVTLDDVRSALRKIRFRGSVFLVLNVCHAEGIESAVPAVGLGDDADFSWVILYSSYGGLRPPYNPPSMTISTVETGGCRGAWPPYAAHVMRVVARLVAERPTYSALQDRVDALWVETRDPTEPGKVWKGPPTIRMRNVKGDERIL